MNNSIVLREFVMDDWIGVHKYASQEMVCKYQPWGPNTEEESKDFVMEVIRDAKQVPRTRFTFAVIFNDILVGAGEFNIRDFSNRAGEIGYIVNPDYWNKGIATEVASRLINFGFIECKLHRIYATCDPRNVVSAKVLEKVGMVKEGTIRDDLLLRDGWRDSNLYSILEQEWRL